MAWIDSHCHLQDEYRREGTSVAESAAQASASGVRGLVCVGTGPSSSREALAVVETLRSLPGPGQGPFEAWATVGLHPHDASTGLGEVVRVLEEAIGTNPGMVVAVGECGLDYHYDHSPREVQRDVFAQQVSLARERGLALVVHSRDAWDDTIDILTAEHAPERTVLHCFTGGPAQARRCLDLGAYLSFSGIVTFKNAAEVREAVALCPLNRLMVETDAPFLAPVPHRGEDNRPAWVTLVGEAVAQIKSSPAEDVAIATTSATREVFSLG